MKLRRRTLLLNGPMSALWLAGRSLPSAYKGACVMCVRDGCGPFCLLADADGTEEDNL